MSLFFYNPDGDTLTPKYATRPIIGAQICAPLK